MTCLSSTRLGLDQNGCYYVQSAWVHMECADFGVAHGVRVTLTELTPLVLSGMLMLKGDG